MGTRLENKETLSAQIDAAIAYLKNESISPVSISGVCRLVGVNRANLYAHYPELLTKIRAARVKRASDKAAQSTFSHLSLEIASLKKRLKATTFICIELQLALKVAQDQLRRELAKNRDRRRKP